MVQIISKYFSLMNCFCVWNILFHYIFFCHLCIGQPLICVYYFCQLQLYRILLLADSSVFIGQPVISALMIILPPPFSYVPFLPLDWLCPGLTPFSGRESMILLPFGLVHVCCIPIYSHLLRVMAVELYSMPLQHLLKLMFSSLQGLISIIYIFLENRSFYLGVQIYLHSNLRSRLF